MRGWARTSSGQILDAGYNFDFIDDTAIAKAGVNYKVVVLPAPQRMPDATKKKLEEYKRFGGFVFDTRETPNVGAAIRKAITPDLERAPEIGFVHRHLPYAEVYFLANTSNHRVESDALFRTGEFKSAWWNPLDGRETPAPSALRQAGGLSHLDLAPYESRVVVFSKAGVKGPNSLMSMPPWTMPIDSPWRVTFEKTGITETVRQLASWTDNDRTRYFSGVAAYETTVQIDNVPGVYYLSLGKGTPVDTMERHSGNGMRAMYESPVREAAKVYVNGKYAGAVWSAPYEVYIGDLLRKGENTLRIEVANLALNELAKGPLPDYKALNAKYGERFQPQDLQNLQPVPAGLLEPVTIILRPQRTP